jgi:hypothetical protein
MNLSLYAGITMNLSLYEGILTKPGCTRNKDAVRRATRESRDRGGVAHI